VKLNNAANLWGVKSAFLGRNIVSGNTGANRNCPRGRTALSLDPGAEHGRISRSSLRKLQLPLNRLEARLTANGIEQEVGLHQVHAGIPQT